MLTGLMLESFAAVANQGVVVITKQQSSFLAKGRKRSPGNITPQEEQQIKEMIKTKDEYDAAQNPIIQEMRVIRVNWQTTNASKRVLLKKFRPRLDANLQTYGQKMQAYKDNPLYKLITVEKLQTIAYEYMDCPADDATMCF